MRVISTWPSSWHSAVRLTRGRSRAARDYGQAQPEFAVAAGLAALSWISVGHGYEITATDVLDAYPRADVSGGRQRYEGTGA